MDVAVDGRRLGMRYNRITTPFEHWHFEVFNGLENVAEPVFHNTKLQFVSGVEGRVEALLVTMDPLVEPIRFERRPDARLRDPAYLARLTGRYTMAAGGEVVVGLRGDRLTIEVPGNPLYVLQPDRDHEFTLAELSGYRVRFVFGRDGAVRELQLVQPNGIFTATPVR